mmetsp:Transcript_20758/g.44902  ORF Transcript_20758/g.44902 Transcript_20758/m.44902 type:complete len:218 (-) Transcript_20758:602-1255(-)
MTQALRKTVFNNLESDLPFVRLFLLGHLRHAKAPMECYSRALSLTRGNGSRSFCPLHLFARRVVSQESPSKLSRHQSVVGFQMTTRRSFVGNTIVCLTSSTPSCPTKKKKLIDKRMATTLLRHSLQSPNLPRKSFKYTTITALQCFPVFRLTNALKKIPLQGEAFVHCLMVMACFYLMVKSTEAVLYSNEIMVLQSKPMRLLNRYSGLHFLETATIT